ncbi:Penicillin-binding protein 2B [Lentibacillus sp. JNUCC-1]|uniref:penicillin-binding protein n=1 Tax=Lentibacillus sp. JNUCC-1 TaxID=2654513 RepID=UPI0012E8C347|nr:penicillin-binding protein [Lentibacillus sp. JNUCC-1]MUV36227.1 Penicillin-binding protein 2B [Lentibacillus sp. JNUCC-1]
MNKNKHKHTHLMAGIFIVIFAFVFLGVAGRFLYIQASGTVNDVSLKEWAKDKRTTSYSISAERGKILDKNGVELAYDHPTFTLFATVDDAFTVNEKEPQHVVDPQKTAEKLAPFLDVDESYILERIEWGLENEKTQVEFGSSGKELSQKTKDDIEDLELPGIGFTKHAIRYYPNGLFASRIVGFAQKNESGNIKGVTGMEKQMDDMLQGEPGHISYERDRFGTKLLNPNEVVKKPEDGNNIALTIDQKVQTLLEDVMTQVETEYKPSRMTAIVMDPKTGEIVAMSNRPSYNPNHPDNIQNWYNDAVSTPIEPGSTMKMLTWAAAIESGNYKGDELYESGKYQVSDLVTPVHDHNNGKGWGEITYDEGFRRSSNVAASKLVWEKMGPDTFLDYLHAFDMDKKTGIDLPGEVTGKIVYRWPSDKLTASFGQGSTYTPIQLMKAASAIANDGQMMTPFVKSKIIDSSNGKVIEEKAPKPAGQPISKETADRVLDLLEDVVTEEGGTGHIYALEDYSVAGKTGTAQIANPDAPGHLRGRENNIFSFLGMAPKDDPKLMMLVQVKQPELKPTEYGSMPVSFIFKNVMENSLHYLNIDPDKETDASVNPIQMPKVKGATKDKLEQFASKHGLKATFIGKASSIISANVKKDDLILPGQRLIFVTENPIMPDISGWSKRDVLQLADMLDLEIKLEGEGYAVKQSISAGEKIKGDKTLSVTFDVLETTQDGGDNSEDNTNE